MNEGATIHNELIAAGWAYRIGDKGFAEYRLPPERVWMSRCEAAGRLKGAANA
jgi:hypothetical protein